MQVTTPISFGTFNGPSYAAIGTGGLGFVEFQPQSAAPSTPASNTFRLFANSAGKFTWIGANGFQRIFDGTANTSDRTYTLPDMSGTMTVLGNTSTGSGNVVLATSPTLTTPVLGVSSGTSLALGGATIGTDALGVAGTATVSTTLTANTSLVSPILVQSSDNARLTAGGVRIQSSQSLGWSASGGSSVAADVFLTRGAPAAIQHGAADAASPVAQTVKFQDVVAGTSNTVGANATIQGSAGTGTGAGGSLVFQVAPAGSTGTAKNAWANAVVINSSGAVQVTTTGTTTGTIGAGSNGFGTLQIGAASYGSSGLMAVRGGSDNFVAVRGAAGYAWENGGNNPASGTLDLWLTRIAAANLRLGNASSATPVANTLTIGESSRSGTDTNVAGANGTIQSGQGTGNATGAALVFQTPTAVASGSGAQTYTTRLTLSSGGAAFTQNITAFSGSMFIGNTAGASGYIFNNNGGLYAGGADGVFELLNNAGTSFGRLQFGGTTSSFPAIKRNGTAINIRLADDSGDAPITASTVTASGVVVLASFTVAGLPAAIQGGTAFVTDSTLGFSAGLGLTVVGGGSNKVPVYSDGSTWIIG